MATTDARPHPLKAQAYRRYFAFRTATGALVPGWTGAAAAVSTDGSAFTATVDAVTEIGTSGVGYLDLTSGEMNADAVVLTVLVSNPDALPLVFTFFPEEVTDRAPLVSETQAGLATAAALAAVDSMVDAILADTAALEARVPASPADVSDIPSADSIADALLDRADGIETALTVREALRLVVAASAGKLSGAATTTVTIRNVGDTATRITAQCDSEGNRTAVLTDVS